MESMVNESHTNSLNFHWWHDHTHRRAGFNVCTL